MDFTLKQEEPFYDDVEWLDTDASEDEDYLPQFPNQQQVPILPSIKDYFLKQNNNTIQQNFNNIVGSSFDSNSSIDTQEDDDNFFDDVLVTRNRMNSISWDINNNTSHSRLTISSETPCDKVRRAIDKTIDNGIERVDISHVGLTEIPDEIEELQYVTVVHNDVVKTAALQIYLYGNDIQVLNPCLFRLKSLTVLSLRNNRLTTIPPEIGLLENLVELSLGNNQLKTIPAELLRLKGLTILSLFPNPFLPLSNDKSHRQRIKQTKTSLKEIATRTILSSITSVDTMIRDNHCILPADILHRFQSISNVNYCKHCKLLFHIPDIEEIVWRTVLGNHHVPVLYRFCSIRCCNISSIKDQELREEEAATVLVTTTAIFAVEEA